MIASAVDPRTKALVGIPGKHEVPPHVVSDKAKVWKAVEELLVLEYMKKQDTPIPSITAVPTSTQASKVSMPSQAIKNIMKGLSGDDDDDGILQGADHVPLDPKQNLAMFATQAAQFELRGYMKVPAEDISTDPLQWWKLNQNTFPLIAPIARRYLAIPASSAASERTFSTAGNIVTNKRCRLHPETVSTLVFLNGTWTQLEEMEHRRKMQRSS
jgi:hypothetical protein